MSNVLQLPKPAPDAEFAWVKADDVSATWDLVRPGIEEVARYGDHWRPEDVYMALRQGQAHLHVVRVSGAYAGCVVAMPSRGHDGPVLHVWAVYAEPQFPGLRQQCMAQLKQWARDMNARRITFTSPRKGWEKVGRELGFVPTLTIFECEV